MSESETPFKFGYATLVILGAQKIQAASPGSMQYLETLHYLFSKGLPPDVEDIVGHTALHHATTWSLPQDVLVQCLLEHCANPNHQNRFGEVSDLFHSPTYYITKSFKIALLSAMQLNWIPTINLLMQFNTDLDLADADGWTARGHFLSCGPQVTAAVTHWISKHSGEAALHAEKCCDSCGRSMALLKHCARCKTARYCSPQCQSKHCCQSCL